MTLWLVICAWVFSAMAFLPALVLFVEAILALYPNKRRFAEVQSDEVRTVILVPAHNEAANIRHTLRSLRENAPQAQILVIADNCSDDTAREARRCEAQVIERTNQTLRGKAYALGFGMDHLKTAPPDAVVVVDADAKVKGDALTRVAAISVVRNHPIQTLNVVDRFRSRNAMSVVTVLGNRLHNIVRPLALQRLGCPCLLMGSGMVFPWHIATQVGLANDSLGEDKQLGIDMMLAGHTPEFFLGTKVASRIAEHGQGYEGQRSRWEQGHLLVAIREVPRLLWQAIRRCDYRYLAMAIELAVPPMALLAAGLCIALVVAAPAAWLGLTKLPSLLTLFASGMLLATLGITWCGFARRRVSLGSLLSIPWYIARKVPIYVSLLLRGPQKVWLRTDRPEA